MVEASVTINDFCSTQIENTKRQSLIFMSQPKQISNNIVGLHRPFNKPLKSLVWVCRFTKKYSQKKGQDFYIDFFLWMLEAICTQKKEFPIQNADGIVKYENAQRILSLFKNQDYSEIHKKVRSVLSERNTEEDRIIYSSYKNTSYYITLAKKVELIQTGARLTLLGEGLASIRDYHFFVLSDKHKDVVFRSLCPLFFDNLVIICRSNYYSKNYEKMAESYFRTYLKKNEEEGVIKYITSFDDNYLEVLRTWVDTLKLFTASGLLRLKYLKIVDEMGLRTHYEALISNTETFYKKEFQKFVKQEQQYDKIRKSYEYHYKRGEAEFGYVNLYDIKKSFRLSYDNFNELIDSYYTEYRHKEIILFSNTVSSIDMRRRFIVAGNAVLKIRIIKKS
jgi:hypothetical protein